MSFKSNMGANVTQEWALSSHNSREETKNNENSKMSTLGSMGLSNTLDKYDHFLNNF